MLVLLDLPAAHAAHVNGSVARPDVSARAAILIEPDIGDVVYKQRPDIPLPIASTTKLMTALITLEHLPLDRRVAVAPYPASSAESTAGLRTGEVLSVADLLRAALLASANEAAYTLAVRVAGSEAAFVALMNAKAKALGLRQTHFNTPVGLDTPGNYSTARELAHIAAVDLRNRFFAETVARPSVRLTTGAHVRLLINRNDLVGRVPYVDGVKTGHTLQAGYVLVGAARHNGIFLVSVVLGDRSMAARDADTAALLRYGFSRYHTVTLVRRGQSLARVAVHFAGGRVALVAQTTVRQVLGLEDHPVLTIASLPTQVTGPLHAGTPVGLAVVRLGGRPLAQVALVTQRALTSPTLGQRLRTYFGHPLTIALVVILVGCSLLLAVLRRRAVRRRRARRTQGFEA